jgi:hypothetical protein
MNKDLKHRIFDIPQNILDKINHTIVGLNGTHVHGVQRAKKLLMDKKVKYWEDATYIMLWSKDEDVLKEIEEKVKNIPKVKTLFLNESINIIGV